MAKVYLVFLLQEKFRGEKIGEKNLPATYLSRLSSYKIVFLNG